MKFKALFSFCLAAGALSSVAQTHVEGVEYFKADQFDNARELLERNLPNKATDKAVANFYLGLIALQDGDTSKAKSYFEKGITANPDYGYNYVGNAELLLKNGDVKEAEKMFKLAESKAKKDPAMQIQIARAYYNVDPVAYAKEIEKRLEKARRINIQAPEIFIFEGDMLVDQKEWGNAGSKYEMAANYNPMAADAYVKYANLFNQVNPDYAIRMLNQLLQNNPNSALGQREIAMAYYNKKDYANAATQYGKYVRNPNHFKQDEDRYAFLLFFGQKYKDGYEYASQLLNTNPQNFTARRYQFMNAAQLPELKEKLLPMADELLAAHKTNVANKFAPIDYTLIAEELSGAKRTDEAIDVINEAIAENPENASFNKQLAMLYVDKDDFAQAANSYKDYLKKTKEPGYNDYIQQALFSYYAGVTNKESNPELATQSFKDAEEYSNKAAIILPTNYKPLKIKGDVAKQTASQENIASAAQPMYMEAVGLLEASPDPIKYASDAKDMYSYLGYYYMNQKEIGKAREYFNKYLGFDPNNENMIKLLNQLK